MRKDRLRWARQTFADYGILLRETVAELPTPQGPEVPVRVGHCGVCHSDLHLHDGYCRKLEFFL